MDEKKDPSGKLKQPKYAPDLGVEYSDTSTSGVEGLQELAATLQRESLQGGRGDRPNAGGGHTTPCHRKGPSSGSRDGEASEKSYERRSIFSI